MTDTPEPMWTLEQARAHEAKARERLERFRAATTQEELVPEFLDEVVPGCEVSPMFTIGDDAPYPAHIRIVGHGVPGGRGENYTPRRLLLVGSGLEQGERSRRLYVLGLISRACADTPCGQCNGSASYDGKCHCGCHK